MPMVATFFSSSTWKRNQIPDSVKKWFGITSSKSSVASRLCTTSKFAIGTSSARIYSWPRAVSLSLATWTCRKFRNRVWWKRRLVLLTTHARRCGRTCLTISDPTYGPLAVFCTKWSPICPLSVQLTWKACIAKLYLAGMSRFQAFTPKTWKIWSPHAWRCAHQRGLAATRFWKCLACSTTWLVPLTKLSLWKKRPKFWCPQLGFPDALDRSLNVCLQAIMSVAYAQTPPMVMMTSVSRLREKPLLKTNNFNEFQVYRLPWDLIRFAKNSRKRMPLNLNFQLAQMLVTSKLTNLKVRDPSAAPVTIKTAEMLKV